VTCDHIVRACESFTRTVVAVRCRFLHSATGLLPVESLGRVRTAVEESSVNMFSTYNWQTHRSACGTVG
jgi:hypothetical protein